jgi:translation initiation factor 1
MNSKTKHKLVWSDDPKDKPLIDDGKKTKAKSEGVVIASDFTAVFRIEKGGRGGKAVTVIDQLPKHETFLKELCKELKAKCGSGGTFSSAAGNIEIQGDKRVEIKKIFSTKGFKFKGM